MTSTEMELSVMEKRLSNLEAQITLIANALKKKRLSGLDVGLEELRIGKVHRYRSVKALVSDVWG